MGSRPFGVSPAIDIGLRPAAAAEASVAAAAAVDLVLADAAAALVQRATDPASALQVAVDVRLLGRLLADARGPPSPAAGAVARAAASADDALGASLAKEADATYTDVVPTIAAEASPSPGALRLAALLSSTSQRVQKDLSPADASAVMRHAALALCTRVASILGDVVFGSRVSLLPSAFFPGLAAEIDAIVAAVDSENAALAADALAELRQLADLASAPDVRIYTDAAARARLFPALRSSRVIAALKKVREPADRKRQAEDLILLLR